MNILDLKKWIFVLNFGFSFEWILNWISFSTNSMEKWIFKTYQPLLPKRGNSRTLQKEVVEDNFGSDFLFNGKSRNDSFIELDKIWTFIACCGFSIRPEGLIKQHHSNSCLCITETPHFYAIDLSSWQYINMFLETLLDSF